LLKFSLLSKRSRGPWIPMLPVFYDTAWRHHSETNAFAEDLEHPGEPQQISPLEATRIAGQCLSPTQAPVRGCILQLTSHKAPVQAELLNCEIARLLRDQNVDVRPEWANGAWIFMQGLGPADFWDARIFHGSYPGLGPSHIVIRHDDVPLLGPVLDRIAQLPDRNVRATLKPGCQRQIFSDIGSLSLAHCSSWSFASNDHSDARSSDDHVRHPSNIGRQPYSDARGSDDHVRHPINIGRQPYKAEYRVHNTFIDTEPRAYEAQHCSRSAPPSLGHLSACITPRSQESAQSSAWAGEVPDGLRSPLLDVDPSEGHTSALTMRWPWAMKSRCHSALFGLALVVTILGIVFRALRPHKPLRRSHHAQLLATCSFARDVATYAIDYALDNGLTSVTDAEHVDHRCDGALHLDFHSFRAQFGQIPGGLSETAYVDLTRNHISVQFPVRVLGEIGVSFAECARNSATRTCRCAEYTPDCTLPVDGLDWSVAITFTWNGSWSRFKFVDAKGFRPFHIVFPVPWQKCGHRGHTEDRHVIEAWAERYINQLLDTIVNRSLSDITDDMWLQIHWDRYLYIDRPLDGKNLSLLCMGKGLKQAQVICNDQGCFSDGRVISPHN